MSKRIVIDPVTRIEGHAKIRVFIDNAGNVSDAIFHVVESAASRNFARAGPGEMPGITPRICGICPVSHLLAWQSRDAIMAVNIPPAADKLRRLMNLGQLVQSHALSFFHLSAPDFLMGWDTPPAQRNVFGLIAGTRNWPTPASACASLARKSSKSSAAKKSILRGPCPAASAARSPRKAAPKSVPGCQKPSPQRRLPSTCGRKR